MEQKLNDWVKQINLDLSQSRIKAIYGLNEQMIMFFRRLGKSLHDSPLKKIYGEEIYKVLSNELVKIKKGIIFSPENLQYMEKFYLVYGDVIDESIVILSRIAWGHHVVILDYCKTSAKAYRYVARTISENLSIAQLKELLESKTYENSKKSKPKTKRQNTKKN